MEGSWYALGNFQYPRRRSLIRFPNDPKPVHPTQKPVALMEYLIRTYTNEGELVLMDIMMPEMDGYEAMTRIREKKEYKKLPIIALTAKAMKNDREKCIEAGANDYIAKPVDIDQLLSMLRVWLS